jgi:altronate hydrolase
MYINCGRILDGTPSMDEMGEQIFRHILRTASGDKTKSEELGLGDHEFVPWQIGITG